MPDIAVTQDRITERFVIAVDGVEAGFTQYAERGPHRVFIHTETDAAFAGQGLASELVRSALEQTRAQGRRIIAVCPYVSLWVGRHHEFDDILDPAPESRSH
jgi:predicted GNAT family acetyltransferase